jgi:recombination protein RecR
MSSLPGIGKRSALRLVLFLLDQSNKEVKDFSNAFLNLKEHLNFCEECFHITEKQRCEICRNPSRSDETICVVQDIRDLLAIESTEQFYGKYHVLGGVISPMEGIGPDDLKINELKKKNIG